MIQSIIAYLLARASERSTVLGFLTLVPVLGGHASMIATVAACVASAGLVLVKERRKMSVAVIASDVIPVIVPVAESVLANATISHAD